MRSGLATIEEVADEAAASTVVRDYLKMRNVSTVGTLALMATDEAGLRKVLIDPLMSGWKDGTNTIVVAPLDQPIAHAMLLHMWNLARSQWLKSNANCANVQSIPTTPSAPAGSAADKDREDRVPKALPSGVWSNLIQAYNKEQLHGRDRSFPVKELMGAEHIVARMWHEHHRSKLYTPLYLGELLQHRSFQSNGDLNPLAKGQKKLTNLCLEEGNLVHKEEAVWQPKSILAIIVQSGQ